MVHDEVLAVVGRLPTFTVSHPKSGRAEWAWLLIGLAVRGTTGVHRGDVNQHIGVVGDLFRMWLSQGPTWFELALASANDVQQIGFGYALFAVGHDHFVAQQGVVSLEVVGEIRLIRPF